MSPGDTLVDCDRQKRSRTRTSTIRRQDERRSSNEIRRVSNDRVRPVKEKLVRIVGMLNRPVDASNREKRFRADLSRCS